MFTRIFITNTIWSDKKHKPAEHGVTFRVPVSDAGKDDGRYFLVVVKI